jgi:DNA-binding response OmpR family regulator
MPVRILVVEDDPADMELIVYALQAAGFEAICAHDGVEGHHLASRESPDLIITELDLPRMEGSAMLQRLEQDGALNAVPVLVLANDSTDGGHGPHCDDIILKPIEPASLVDAVERLMARSAPWHVPGRENGNHPDC